MRLCFVNAFRYLKCLFLKGIFTLVQFSPVKPLCFKLASNNGHSSLILLHFYKQGRDGFDGHPPQSSSLQSRRKDKGETSHIAAHSATLVLQMAAAQ